MVYSVGSCIQEVLGVQGTSKGGVYNLVKLINRFSNHR